MQPFSRETITDRRQPYIRWTAVVAGALVALGAWMLLQLLLTGAALSAIDPDEIDHMRGYGIGASIGSVLAPILAMLAGGLVAGRLAEHYDHKVSAFHGVLVWTISSIIGIALIASTVGSLASATDIAAHARVAAPPPGASEMIDATVDDLNIRQKAASAPKIDKAQLIDAARYAMQGRDVYDRNAFVVRLDDKTSLSRPEAEAVATNLGDRANDVMLAGNDLAIHRERALAAAEDAGKGMFGAGIALLLCLIAAAGGALLGAKLRMRGRRGDGDTVVTAQDPRTTSPHSSPYSTAPYPTVTPPR